MARLKALFIFQESTLISIFPSIKSKKTCHSIPLNKQNRNTWFAMFKMAVVKL